MRQFVVGAIRAYQYLLGPLRPPTCRFTPTCSHYACDAVARHGVWRGAWLSFKRITRCNPWNPGGYDPAP